MKKFVVLFAIGNLFVSQALAASATGTATANIVTSLSIVETTALSFGSFSAGSQESHINSDGTVGLGNAIVISPGNSAIFRVTGTPNQNFNVSLSGVGIPRSGSNSMQGMDLIYSNSQQLSAAGIKDLTIRGTLIAKANQPVGNYTSTFNVTVNY